MTGLEFGSIGNWQRLDMTFTHISLASHFWDIGKQCRPRSGSILFSHRNFYQNYDKNEKKVYQTPLK